MYDIPRTRDELLAVPMCFVTSDPAYGLRPKGIAMFSKLFKKTRAEDANVQKHGKTDRLVKKEGFWFFHTREGVDVGPFNNRHDAQYALLYFVERSDWPSEQQLADFIEGCELIEGLKK